MEVEDEMCAIGDKQAASAIEAYKIIRKWAIEPSRRPTLTFEGIELSEERRDMNNHTGTDEPDALGVHESYLPKVRMSHLGAEVIYLSYR